MIANEEYESQFEQVSHVASEAEGGRRETGEENSSPTGAQRFLMYASLVGSDIFVPDGGEGDKPSNAKRVSPALKSLPILLFVLLGLLVTGNLVQLWQQSSMASTLNDVHQKQELAAGQHLNGSKGGPLLADDVALLVNRLERLLDQTSLPAVVVNPDPSPCRVGSYFTGLIPKAILLLLIWLVFVKRSNQQHSSPRAAVASTSTEKLQGIIDEKDAAITQLKEEMAAGRDRKVGELEFNHKALQAELEDNRERLAKQEGKLKETETNNSDLKRKIEEQTLLIERISISDAQHKAELEASNEKVTEQGQLIAELSTSEALLESQLEVSREEKERILVEMKEKESTFATKLAEAEQKRDSVERKEAAAMLANAKKLKADAKARQAKLDAREKELGLQHMQLEEDRGKNFLTESAVTTLEQQVGELRAKLSFVELERDNLASLVEAREANVVAQETELNEREAQLNELLNLVMKEQL